MLEQRAQLIQLSRQYFNVLLGRDAQTVQRAGNTVIESLLDFVELHFNLAFHAVDVAGHSGFNAIDLAVSRFNLFVDQLFTLLLDAFTALNQRLEVLGTFLTGFGVCAQASQVNFAGVDFGVAQHAAGFFNDDFLLNGNFRHGAPHSKCFEETPTECRLRYTVSMKIRNRILSVRKNCQEQFLGYVPNMCCEAINRRLALRSAATKPNELYHACWASLRSTPTYRLHATCHGYIAHF